MYALAVVTWVCAVCLCVIFVWLRSRKRTAIPLRVFSSRYCRSSSSSPSLSLVRVTVTTANGSSTSCTCCLYSRFHSLETLVGVCRALDRHLVFGGGLGSVCPAAKARGANPSSSSRSVVPKTRRSLPMTRPDVNAARTSPDGCARCYVVVSSPLDSCVPCALFFVSLRPLCPLSILLCRAQHPWISLSAPEQFIHAPEPVLRACIQEGGIDNIVCLKESFERLSADEQSRTWPWCGLGGGPSSSGGCRSASVDCVALRCLR